MDTFIKTSQFLLSLSFLIVLHELGHFAPAKWFKTRVEKFYLFFDAWGKKLFSFTKGGTEYGIGWLPLGGYVKISGMIDESMDKEQMKGEPQPWEFRSKPAWQRLIIMIGGVTVNFILGFLIFGFMYWYYGEAQLPVSEVKYGMAMDSVMLRNGFQQGDIITKVGDVSLPYVDPGAFHKAVALDNHTSVTVLRNGKEEVVNLPQGFADEISKYENVKKNLYTARIPFIIEKIKPGDPADNAGLKVNDRILALNGQATDYYDQFGPLAKANKDQTVKLTIDRDGEMIEKQITISAQGTIGVFPRGYSKFFNIERKKYSLAEALPAGVDRGMAFLGDQLKAFKQMFAGKISAKDNLGSLISIGNMFPSYWDWEIFWTITASLSIILAFMNLLPIPALDGGYVMFLIWEVITGRRVSDEFMEKAVTVGFFLLIGLMIYALGLDLMRFVF
jgi:regulator of sigma E protease